MRTRAAFHATAKRLRRPTTWGAVLAVGLVWTLTRFTTAESLGWREAVFPFGLALFLLGLSPIPWQWSGDERLRAPFGRGLAQALLWNALGMAALLTTLGPPPRPPHPHPPGPERHMPRLPRGFYLGVVDLSFGLMLGWFLAEKERAEAMERAALESSRSAQARALQAQLNPHVLYNAISGLSELVREDSAAAEEALVSLADLLRRLVDHGGRPLAPLSEERALVEQYLAIESIRLGKRLHVHWAWDAALEGLLLPPLLLQPLVENAVKHGISPAREGGLLEIRLGGAPSELRLEVTNTGRPLGEVVEGTGLRNLRERLALLGLGPEALSLSSTPECTVAALRLALEAAP